MIYSLSKKIFPIVKGAGIIVPVNLLTETNNMVNYGDHITPETFLINSALVYSIYTFDRYRDSKDNYIDIDIDNKNKYELYKGILENENTIEFLIFSSTISTLILLINLHYNSIIVIYLSTFLYKNIKEIKFPIKPIYVSFLWTICTCFISNHENIDIHTVLPFFLNIFSLTNLEDIKDYGEDIKYNISTLPTVLGKETTYLIGFLCSIVSCLLFMNLEYFSFYSLLCNTFLISNISPYITFNTSQLKS